MHRNNELARERIERVLASVLIPAIHRATAPVELEAWEVPGEPVPVADALTATYSPAGIGQEWGRPWGTTWFRVRGRIPRDWDFGQDRVELRADLGFDHDRPGFQAEALAFDSSGQILKGVEPMNSTVPIDVSPGEDFELYLEAAGNPDMTVDWTFTPTPLGSLETAGSEHLYRVTAVDVGLRDSVVWELVADVRALLGLLSVLPEDRPRYAFIMTALERMSDVIDPADVHGTAATGRRELAEVLASPAHASAHKVVATGHAHIDSAWLWPTRETIRKCARTFSNVLALMDEDPDFVFSCSSAQQYAWIQQYYPDLFERIRERVAEGRFVPVGGMWVESDTNMPGGEAMLRQFLLGKGYFSREFGVDTEEVWLPDSFGYSAGLPQIAVGAGNRWFLTQKISWNDTNTMPHHSFWWEGIDGTRIFTHFPPADTYVSDVSATDLDRAERQFADKGAANVSLLPFGYGDGGGGPSREMVAAAHRTADLEGSPRVRIGTSRSFFTEAQAEYADPPVWSGEMYLELHRGTYTSQARTKRGNRRSEHLLREAEIWAATATVHTGAAYPQRDLEEIWQTVLLQQFHDILPGSAIAWVHREAEANYDALAVRLHRLIDASLHELTGAGSTALVANAGPLHSGGARALGVEAAPDASAQSGSSSAAEIADDGSVVLDNGQVRVSIDPHGLIRSAVHLDSGRDIIDPDMPANELRLFRDTPTKWDAWDIDSHYRRIAPELGRADSIEVHEIDGQPTAVITWSIGVSAIVQKISLVHGAPVVTIAMDVDWRERQKLLKLAFPVAVHADRHAAETQFGHLFRPTHANTSWDAARFETCAHRWVHVAEPGFGVGVANDSTYGYDVRREAAGHGGSVTTVSLSLLRAPLYPDPDSDQGQHSFACSLVIDPEITTTIAEGYRLNVPPRQITGATAIEPLISVDNPAVLTEAIKLAEDGSGDLIVRVYESTGSAQNASVVTRFGWHTVVQTDLLERPDGTDVIASADTVTLSLRAFEIRTLRFERGDDA